MKWITDRIRVFLFGICVGVLGLISPSKALQSAHRALDKTDL